MTGSSPLPARGRSFSRSLLGLGVLSALLLAVTGCGTTRRLSTSAMLPILHGSLDEAFRDKDLRTIEAAIPANLTLVRGVCAANPEHRDLHQLASQLYFSYALGFVEDVDPARAALLYEEGLRLGRRGLATRAWFRDAEAQRSPEIDPDILRRISRDDVPLLFWTLANWAGWIQQHLEDPAAIAQMPRVESYLSRILELEPDYFLGLPHALVGSVQCFRPVMLGGRPEEGRAHFEESMRISGNRMLLFPVLYAQFYSRSTLDREGFESALQGVLAAPGDLLPEYRLFNEVAKEKATRLLGRADEYF